MNFCQGGESNYAVLPDREKEKAFYQSDVRLIGNWQWKRLTYNCKKSPFSS